MHLNEGESATPHWDENPHIRREYESAIRREDVELRMDEAFYAAPEGARRG